jgi:hypothetical protein
VGSKKKMHLKNEGGAYITTDDTSNFAQGAWWALGMGDATTANQKLYQAGNDQLLGMAFKNGGG